MFAPQPVLWFPAAEPTAGQQADYRPKQLRVEFVEGVAEGTFSVEREEDLPAPAGLTGTASTEGGSLTPGTYFSGPSARSSTGRRATA